MKVKVVSSYFKEKRVRDFAESILLPVSSAFIAAHNKGIRSIPLTNSKCRELVRAYYRLVVGVVTRVATRGRVEALSLIKSMSSECRLAVAEAR